MEITPDAYILWQGGIFKINVTIAVTWLIMLFLVTFSAVITRRLSSGEHLSRWQNLLEIIVSGIERQIKDAGIEPPRDFLPFLGTIFLFVAISNLLTALPGYLPPTGSLSTTAALAGSVFVAVPFWGIRQQGLTGYLANYTRPSVIMLPFNMIGEISRTIALAVRLFGNMMSGTMIAAILLSVVPLFFPVVMKVLGLITGLVQAYIFAVLASVYIAAAVKTQKRAERRKQ
jgi:F-type H+-transporting ATPase subunit a